MLSKFDDYCIHQTSEPIRRPATTDRNAYDRYWFNGFDVDGRFYFAGAFGRYPNRLVQDGAFTVVTGGKQYSFYASGLSADDPADTSLGPLVLTVLEPMRSMEVVLGQNDSRVTCHLRYVARSAPLEESRSTRRSNDVVDIDLTRFTQFGRWRGWFEVDGTRTIVDDTTTYGTKDRSWGVRPLGSGEQGMHPSSGAGVFWTWIPLQFETMCTHAWRFDGPKGETYGREALIAPIYSTSDEVPVIEQSVEHLEGWMHAFEFEPGTRRIRGGSIRLQGQSEQERTITFSPPKLTAWMTGLGYGHPVWGHGIWHDDLAFGFEQWDTDTVDLSDERFQLMHQLVEAEMDGARGVGFVEQMIVGPYEPYRFIGRTGVAETS